MGLLTANVDGPGPPGGPRMRGVNTWAHLRESLESVWEDTGPRYTFQVLSADTGEGSGLPLPSAPGEPSPAHRSPAPHHRPRCSKEDGAVQASRVSVLRLSLMPRPLLCFLPPFPAHPTPLPTSRTPSSPSGTLRPGHAALACCLGTSPKSPGPQALLFLRHVMPFPLPGVLSLLYLLRAPLPSEHCLRPPSHFDLFYRYAFVCARGSHTHVRISDFLSCP